MKKNSDPWFRFYVRTLNNPKVQRLPGNIFKGWVNLLCLAKETDGLLPPVEDISFRLRLSKAKTEALLNALRINGLIAENRMHDWDEMQYPSDSSTERVKRHRERVKEQPRNVSCNVPVTAQIRTETETETELPPNRGEYEGGGMPPDFTQEILNQWEACGFTQSLNILEAEKWADSMFRQLPSGKISAGIKGFLIRIKAGRYKKPKSYAASVLRNGGLESFLEIPTPKTLKQRVAEMEEISEEMRKEGTL